MRKLLVAALERIPGLVAMTAEDGQQALEIAQRTSHLDLVITDLNMPVLGGLGLLERLQDLPSTRDAAFVVVSSECADQDAARVRGAHRYLTKPVRLPQVIGVARDMLGLSEF